MRRNASGIGCLAILSVCLGAVAGATVTIVNLATNAQRVLTTNSSGVYHAPSLPPGARLQIEAVDFE